MLLAPVCFLAFRIQFGTNCDNNFGEKIKSNLKQPQANSFEKKFHAAFAFDPVLTQWNALLKMKFFTSSPHPEQAVIGANGFYFYTSQDDKILFNYAKRDLLSASTLDSVCNKWLEDYNEIKSAGIQFVHAVFPNKSTLYRSYVPWQMQVLQKQGPSKTDQLIEAIKAKDVNYPMMDTRIVFKKNKSDNLYHKYDSHWKSAGAFMAFNYIFPNTKTAKAHYKMIEKNAWKFDLLKIMGMCNNQFFLENDFEFKAADSSMEIVIQDSKLYEEAFTTHNEHAQEKKKVVVFGDSFILDTHMRTFLAWQYSDITFCHFHLDMNVVRQLQPDLVVIGNVERYF